MLVERCLLDLVVQYIRSADIDGSSARCDAVASRLWLQAIARNVILDDRGGACEPMVLFSESAAFGLDSFCTCIIVLHLCPLDWLVEKRILMEDGSFIREEKLSENILAKFPSLLVAGFV